MVDLIGKSLSAVNECDVDFFSSVLVRAQMLSELEEIIAFKQFADQPERQQVMRKTWMKRQVFFEPFP